jgi:hypothetical protein
MKGEVGDMMKLAHSDQTEGERQRVSILQWLWKWMDRRVLQVGCTIMTRRRVHHRLWIRF